MTDWDPRLNGELDALYSDGTSVYAGGDFTAAGRAPAGHFAKLDTTPPETTVDGAGRFSSNEDGATFQCSADGGAFAACTQAPAGAQSVAVRAIDLTGNIDPTPAAWTPPAVADAPPAQAIIAAPVVTKAVPPVPPKLPSKTVSVPFSGGYKVGTLPRTLACRGVVTLELKLSKTVIARRSTKLDRRCRYKAAFTVTRKRLGKAKRLTVVVRFHGNRYLGRATNRFTVKVPA